MPLPPVYRTSLYRDLPQQVQTCSLEDIIICYSSITASKRAVRILLERFLVTARKRSCGKVMFFTPVSQSFCSQGGGGLCMMSLPVWLLGSMFILGGGVSVSGPMFLGRGSPNRPSGHRPPLYGKERAVRILLQCFLVTTFSLQHCRFSV